MLARFEKEQNYLAFDSFEKENGVLYRLQDRQPADLLVKWLPEPLPLDQEMHMALTSPNESHDRLKLELW
jgi:hypothetical protein